MKMWLKLKIAFVLNLISDFPFLSSHPGWRCTLALGKKEETKDWQTGTLVAYRQWQESENWKIPQILQIDLMSGRLQLSDASHGLQRSELSNINRSAKPVGEYSGELVGCSYFGLHTQYQRKKHISLIVSLVSSFCYEVLVWR